MFVNFVLHIAKWELWKIRNSVKHENQTFTVNSALDLIVLKIHNAALFIEKKKKKKKKKKTDAERKFSKTINRLKQFV